MAKRIAIVGVGAIGSLIGAMLTKAGLSVILVDQWPEHVEAMKRDGLRVSGSGGEHHAGVKALHIHEVASRLEEPLDILFVSVKSYDTPWAVTLMSPYLKSDGCAVSAQNSINDEVIAGIVGHTRTLGAVVTVGAGLYEPGHVVRTSDPQAVAFKVGELHGLVTPRARELAQILGHVGISQTTSNLWGERWAKLAVNCMVNSLAGLTGLGSRDIRSTPKTQRLCIRIGDEIVRVGKALGYAIEPINGIPAEDYVEAAQGRKLEDVQIRLGEFGKKLGEGRPSLLQDIMKGRRTEIDYLNGLIVRRGKEVGIATPVNAAVVQAVRQVERGDMGPDVANLDRLLALL